MNPTAKHLCAHCGLDVAAFGIEHKGIWYCCHFCKRMATTGPESQSDREKDAKRTIKKVKAVRR